jgi:hypothetical protein
MSKTADPVTYRLLNGLQQAYKLCANSVYGAQGVRLGGGGGGGGGGGSNKAAMVARLAGRPEVAAATAAAGRRAILAAVRLVTSWAEHDVKVVYGDTDSVFVQLVGGAGQERPDWRELMAISKDLAKYVTASLQSERAAELGCCSSGGSAGSEAGSLAPTLVLEFENVFSAFLQPGKKQYCGLSYTTLDQLVGDFVVKGLEFASRDMCGWQQATIAEVVEKVLRIKDANWGQPAGSYLVSARTTAQAALRTSVSRLLGGIVPAPSLCFSMQLKSLESGTIAACVAKKLIARRGPLSTAAAPLSGDRVSYVWVRSDSNGRSIVAMGNKGAASAGQAEDPGYAVTHQLGFMYWSYINGLRRPISKVLRLFDESLARATDGLLKTCLEESTRQRTKQSTLASLFGRGPKPVVTKPPRAPSPAPAPTPASAPSPSPPPPPLQRSATASKNFLVGAAAQRPATTKRKISSAADHNKSSERSTNRQKQLVEHKAPQPDRTKGERKKLLEYKSGLYQCSFCTGAECKDMAEYKNKVLYACVRCDSIPVHTCRLCRRMEALDPVLCFVCALAGRRR